MPRLLAALLLTFAAFTVQADNHAGPVVVVEVEDEFDYIKEAVQSAITDQGLLVSGELHVADMINRTAKDLGFAETVYGKAESIEFCSAEMSHHMTIADPANLVICPFTIAIYELKAKPGMVYLAYRKPVLAGDNAADATQRVLDMLAGIVEEATE